MANWLVVVSEDSFNVSQNKGVLGFYGDLRGSNLIHKTKPGDRLVFYITKKKVVQGLFQIASEPYFDESSLYGDQRDLSWNQRIRLTVVNSNASAEMGRIARDLDFIKSHACSYGAYLRKTLVEVSDKDLATVLDAMGIPAASPLKN